MSLQDGIAHPSADIKGICAVFAVVKTAVVLHQFPVLIEGDVRNIARCNAVGIVALAAVGTQLVGNQFCEGGFTAAVSAEYGNVLVRRPLPIKVVENGIEPIGKTDIVELDEGFRHGNSGAL